MAPDSYNRLPAGMMAPASAPSASPDPFSADSGPGQSALPLILSVIALLLAGSAIYLAISKAPAPAITAEDRLAIRSIADSLRSMQQKEFVTSSPDITTTVLVEKSFPISDMMPANLSVPITADIPIQSTVTGISQSGQVVTLRINDTLHVRAIIPLSISQNGSEVMVNIHQEVPVNTRIRGSFRFSDVFPTEFNTIIQQLEELGAEPVK